MDEQKTEVNQHAILPEGTEEQKAFFVAGEDAKKLLKQKTYQQIVAAMIAFRRSYALALHELHRSLDQEEGVHPLTGDYFVMAAMSRAAMPFDSRALITSYPESVLPWMAGVIDGQIIADQEAEREAAQKTEAERRATPIELPYVFDLELQRSLPRGQSLVLAGAEPARKHLLELAVAKAIEAGLMVVWLSRWVSTLDSSSRLARFAVSQWRGCANTRTAWQAFGDRVFAQLSAVPDLVVIDDLAEAYTAGYTGRPAGASAGDAHRLLRQWCERLGAALLGGVQADVPQLDSIARPEFEQLRIHSRLRPLLDVPAVDAEDGYHVTIGPYGDKIAVPQNVWRETQKLYVP